MKLSVLSTVRVFLSTLVLMLVLVMANKAEAVDFSFPKVVSDPDPLHILGPAGERFTFMKTGETTNGQYLMADAVIPPGGGPLPHIHHYTDEWFYFPDGGLTLEMGNNLYPDLHNVPGVNLPKEHLHLKKTRPGDIFYGPRYHVHGFTNPGKDSKRLVFVWTPDTESSGIANYFKEVGQPMPDPSNPPPVHPANKALFISKAPKYGINQSASFNQYVDTTDYKFPKMDNHIDDLLALLAPDVEGSQLKTAQVKSSTVQKLAATKVVAGKFTAKPEKKQELIQLAKSLFEPSRAEAGCISYSFYEDPISENSFLFFEEWKNQAAINQHFQTPYFKHFMEKFPEMIVGIPSIKIYEVEAVKEVT